MTVTLKPGYGYWDSTKYPIGGCFCRVPRDSAGLEITVTREFPRYQGANREGKTADGRRVAFDIANTLEHVDA